MKNFSALAVAAISLSSFAVEESIDDLSLHLKKDLCYSTMVEKIKSDKSNLNSRLGEIQTLSKGEFQDFLSENSSLIRLSQENPVSLTSAHGPADLGKRKCDLGRNDLDQGIVVNLEKRCKNLADSFYFDYNSYVDFSSYPQVELDTSANEPNDHGQVLQVHTTVTYKYPNANMSEKYTEGIVTGISEVDEYIAANYNNDENFYSVGFSLRTYRENDKPGIRILTPSQSTDGVFDVSSKPKLSVLGAPVDSEGDVQSLAGKLCEAVYSQAEDSTVVADNEVVGERGTESSRDVSGAQVVSDRDYRT